MTQFVIERIDMKNNFNLNHPINSINPGVQTIAVNKQIIGILFYHDKKFSLLVTINLALVAWL